MRCRDAIENLHEEIQGERAAKHQLQIENQQLADLTSQLQLREQEISYQISKEADE
jgi:hypothetical protein